MTSRNLTADTGNSLLRVGRFSIRNLPLALAALWLVLLFFPQLMTPYEPLALNLPQALQPPSPEHWFGTDQYGRDVFTRCLYGLGSSLGAAIVVTIITTVTGLIVGGVAGLGSRWLDTLLMRSTDVFLAFPYLIMAIALAAAIGPSLGTAMLVMSLLWWPSYARMVRGMVLGLREQAFVSGAIAAMTSPAKILGRHLLPHMMPQLSARMSLEVGHVVVALAGLGFLGLGAQPPSPELGLIIAEGREYLLTAWWICTLPGLFIVALVMTSMALSDWIERRIK